MGIGVGKGVTVAVGIGVLVAGMEEGVLVGVDVGGEKTAVQDVSSARVIQSVKRKMVEVGCWHMGAILPSESILKITTKPLTWINQKRFITKSTRTRRFNKFFPAV